IQGDTPLPEGGTGPRRKLPPRWSPFHHTPPHPGGMGPPGVPCCRGPASGPRGTLPLGQAATAGHPSLITCRPPWPVAAAGRRPPPPPLPGPRGGPPPPT